MSLLTALDRVFLGVHFPSDVVGRDPLRPGAGDRVLRSAISGGTPARTTPLRRRASRARVTERQHVNHTFVHRYEIDSAPPRRVGAA